MDGPEIDDAARGFGLLDRASTSDVVTVRDDQNELAWLLDAARECRRRGSRFRVVDSGRVEVVSLCRLTEAGAEIYSSDEARPEPESFLPVALSARKRGSPAFYFIRGPIAEGAEVRAPFLELGRSGTDLHLSNRERKRAIPEAIELAEACRRGKGRLVTYYFGEIDPSLEGLAAAGGWIHWPARGLEAEATLFLVKDIVRAGRAFGAGLVLHIEDPAPVEGLRSAFEAGAYLEFHTPPSESGTDWHRLELDAARRPADARAFYLHRDPLP